MIRIRSKGRLGNQLFIYGFARAMQERFHQGVLFYDRKDEKDPMWHSHLDRYVLSPSVKFTSEKRKVMNMTFSGKWKFFLDRMYSRNHGSRQRHVYQCEHWDSNIRSGLLLMMDGFHEFPLSIPDDIFCDGYFQSPRYIDEVRPQLLKEFVPKDELTKAEKDWMNEILSSESVCVTIRLGDYIGNSVHQVCTKDFFIQAMKRMRELHPHAEFFIFSDEVERARQILDFPFPVHFDSGASQDAVSLFIMSKCKHFIISNSSFSWWAQYLGNAPDKTVIAPDHWYAQDVVCDIMQDTWILQKC